MRNIIKDKFNELIDNRIKNLESRVFNKKSKVQTVSSMMDYYSSWMWGHDYNKKTLEARILELEETVALLLDKLELNKIDIKTEKTVLRSNKKRGRKKKSKKG